MATKGRTQRYYDANPEAKKKKLEYDKKYQKQQYKESSWLKDKKNDQAKFRKKNKLKSNEDASHTKDGRLKRENKSSNRRKNGHGNNKRFS